MKGKILTILIFTFIFFTGCSADYNLVITNKKKVIENVTLLDENENILKTSDSVDYFLMYKKKQFTTIGYNAKNIVGNKYSGLELSNTYKNLNDYADNSIMKYLFEGANIEEDDNLFVFETTGDYLYNDIFSVDLMSDYIYNLDSITVKIKFYNKVVNHNADSVDEKNNIYTWVLSKDNNYDNIMFQLSNEVEFGIMIKDYLSQHKFIFVIIGGVILLIVVLIMNLRKTIINSNSI